MRLKHWSRWTLAAIIVFALAQFVWSLATDENYEWDVFAHYFFAPPVLQGAGLTLLFTGLSAAIGFLLDTLIALARLSKSPLLSSAAWLYGWFFRSVPLVVQLVVWYNLGYLYPTLGLGTPFTTDFWLVEFPTMQLISAFAAGVLGLSLHQAAYSAEIIRGGLLSVDQGQLEAAASLGIPPVAVDVRHGRDVHRPRNVSCGRVCAGRASAIVIRRAHVDQGALERRARRVVDRRDAVIRGIRRPQSHATGRRHAVARFDRQSLPHPGADASVEHAHVDAVPAEQPPRPRCGDAVVVVVGDDEVSVVETPAARRALECCRVGKRIAAVFRVTDA